jgi:AcrR family transcriptional regulator
MARRTPPDRLERLIAVAAAAFVEHGFQRTQMDDIASRLGVSKGTVYGSIDSKESLLAAVLIYGDAPDVLPDGGRLEPTGLAEVSSTLGDTLSRAIAGLELTTMVSGPVASSGATSGAALGAEVERVTIDLYEMMAAHRIRVMVLDRCAAEVPELAGDWYEPGRYAVVDLWREYLDRRSAHIGSDVDRDVLARTIVELVTLWAVKMSWDPAPRPYPADIAAFCATMIRHLVNGEQ